MCVSKQMRRALRGAEDGERVAAGAGRAVIFRKGRKTRVVEEADMLSALLEEVEAVAAGAGE